MISEMAKGVYWVGAVDWSLRQFHGHELSTDHGSSYNAYLIIDEKVALIDTVGSPFQDVLLKNISEIIDPSTIDVVIAAHAEPDHSGSLPAVLQHCPDATVVVSTRGLDSFPRHYPGPWHFKTVKTGERMSLGKKTLTFIEAPMLHWPDNLFTYLNDEAILFSSDAFGQHYASSGRFNDEVGQDILDWEAVKYYANILNPFGVMVGRKIDEILALNLPIKMIAPSHGVIWRDDPMQIAKKYRTWAEQKPARSAVIVYDTMWQATRQMAEAVGDGLAAGGVHFKIYNSSTADRSNIVTEIFLSKAVILGSPTFNQGVLPTLSPVLEDMKGLKFKNKIGAAFGTWGWSGEVVDVLEGHLKASGIEVVAPGVKAKWRPGPDDLEACRGLGRTVAAACAA
jgi:anaerobic nitric oxide reductase flavorubredoxin